MSEETFGNRARAAESAEAFLALEDDSPNAGRLMASDRFISTHLARALSGQLVAHLERGPMSHRMQILDLDAQGAAFVDAAFQLKEQQSKGAWFLPDEAKLLVGTLNYPAYFMQAPRYASGIAYDESEKISLSHSHALCTWSLLEPCFAALLEPFEQRGRLAGTKPRKKQLQIWAGIDELLSAVGAAELPGLDVMRYGGGWSKLRAEQQLAVRAQVLNGLGTLNLFDVARRYRAHVLQKLLVQYYKKAKGGRAERRKVLTKAFHRTLSGFFRGDWLDFLRYLGEKAHDDEHVVGALPEPKLKVGARGRLAKVAEEKGIPEANLERLLEAYWGDLGASPVEDRVAALRAFWRYLDAAHAQQMPGMPPLWGFVEERFTYSAGENTPYAPGLFRRFLDGGLVTEIERLWSGKVLTRWPDRILSEPYPHALMAETFGPALKFWHGVGLTAWFICEGPTSRTDLTGLEHYHRRELAALGEMGCRPDPALFRDLKAAERRLGPEEPIQRSSSAQAVGFGLTVTTSVTIGSRRRGFEILRDAITRHRRAWTSTHLEGYLRALWEKELQATATKYFRTVEERKGKPPTAKQFAKHVVEPATRWFGGNVAGVYRSFGEKSPVEPEDARVLPLNRVAFLNAVRQQLVHRTVATIDLSNRAWDFDRLAEGALKFVEQLEATGTQPEAKKVGFQRHDVLAADQERAWEIYSEAVQQCLERFPKPGEKLDAGAQVEVLWADGSTRPGVIETAAEDHFVVRFGDGATQAVGLAFVVRAAEAGP